MAHGDIELIHMLVTKDSLIKRLRSDPMYKKALGMAKDDAERKRIIAITEGMITNIVEAIIPIAGIVKQDPNIANELKQALKSGMSVIKERDGSSITTGSIG